MTRQRTPKCPLELVLLALACGALLGCTDARVDDTPTHLERQFEDSGQNYALLFDGMRNYVTTATAQFPGAHAEQTVSVWFLLSTLPGKQALFTARKDFESGIELGLSDGILSVWRVYSGKVLLRAKSPVAANTWHHAAYAFDTNTHQIFLDGVLVASSENVNDNRTPNSSWLGTLDGTRDFFHGSMDDMLVFAVLQTPQQIAIEATRVPTPVNSPGLVLDLTFDESLNDSIAFDHSPLANDALLGDGVDEYMPRREPSGVALQRAE